MADRSVSVIGLGSMGAKLAELLLEAGYAVTVWNRTPAKAESLVAAGARLGASPADAVAASPLVVMCVHDYRAVSEILESPGVGAALEGRTLVQLTTGSPKEALAAEAWVAARGAQYVEGAIQAAPSQMARPDTVILVSGHSEAFEQVEPILKVFGGNLKYIGEKASLASAMDAATLSSLYGALIGFLHGARLCESEGFDVGEYANIVAEIIPTFGDFMRHEGAVVKSGDFTTTESPLSISVVATAKLEQVARELGVNAEFPAFVAQLFKRADEAGYGREELGAIIKVMR